MPTTITLQELEQLTESNFLVIDIRSSYEYSKSHLPNSYNIPYDILMMYPESYLNKDQKYYLICDHGGLSHRACVILRSYGYNVANVENGYADNMRRCYCY